MKRLGAFFCRAGLVLAIGVITADLAVAGMLYPAFAVIAAVGVGWRCMRRGWRVSDAYGTARFADWGDLMHGRLLSHTGITLGRLGLMPRPAPP